MFIVFYDHERGFDHTAFHSEENAMKFAADTVMNNAYKECDSTSFDAIRLFFEEGKYEEVITAYNDTNNAEEVISVFELEIND